MEIDNLNSRLNHTALVSHAASIPFVAEMRVESSFSLLHIVNKRKVNIYEAAFKWVCGGINACSWIGGYEWLSYYMKTHQCTWQIKDHCWLLGLLVQFSGRSDFTYCYLLVRMVCIFSIRRSTYVHKRVAWLTVVELTIKDLVRLEWANSALLAVDELSSDSISFL